jgi:hypothetical protein
VRWTVALLLLLLVACKKPDPVVEKAKQEDLEVEKEIAGGAVEAREWTARPQAMGFELSPAEMRELAEAAYDRGALKVWVTGISEIQGREISASMAVELPVTASSREALFGWYRELYDEDQEPTRDVGQSYLALPLD